MKKREKNESVLKIVFITKNDSPPSIKWRMKKKIVFNISTRLMWVCICLLNIGVTYWSFKKCFCSSVERVVIWRFRLPFSVVRLQLCKNSSCMNMSRKKWCVADIKCWIKWLRFIFFIHSFVYVYWFVSKRKSVCENIAVNDRQFC